MPLENGYLLNQRYRILDILGQGGMGAVYRAMDENLEISVAIKENAFSSDDYARQFEREAKVLASLRHPNLPRVFDTFMADRKLQYLVMDYIEGEDLRQWINRHEEISEYEALQIGIEICNALIYLHSRTPAITHRDIKPGNIKITPHGEVILVDFGLVKVMDGKDVTTTAARAMTPGYSPPEQYGDSPTEQRSDIFSLGATLYAALAGYLPEDSLSRATGKAVLTPLKSYNPKVSTTTAEIIEKALELRFEDRWQTATAFKAALLGARGQIPAEAQMSNRIISAAKDGTLNEKDEINGIEPGKPLRNLYSSIRRKGFDSVWVIFAVVIIVLLGLLGTALFWPEGMQAMFPDGPSQTPTVTSLWNPTQETSTQTPLSIVGQPSQSVSPKTEVAEITGTTNNSPTPTGGDLGVLAYVSEQTGIPQIWLLDAANKEISQLTYIEEGACQPDWSPNGTKIVFISPCSGELERYPKASLYILDVENEEIQALPTSFEGDFDPDWSPDGRWIAFTRLLNAQTQLFKIDVNNLEIIRLSDGYYNDFDPDWSLDGTRLVFVRERGYQQIWMMDAEGLNPVQFTSSGAINNTEPIWYQEKDLILFTQQLGLGSPSRQVFGMRLEDFGKDEEYPLIEGNYQNYIPLSDHVDVSPNGTWLAFDLWYHDVLSDIYIMTFPGTNLQQLTDFAGEDYDPVWRP